MRLFDQEVFNNVVYGNAGTRSGDQFDASLGAADKLFVQLRAAQSTGNVVLTVDVETSLDGVEWVTFQQALISLTLTANTAQYASGAVAGPFGSLVRFVVKVGSSSSDNSNVRILVTATEGGADGVSAYTTTTAVFTQPATNANVTVSVVASAWMVPGQVLYVAGGGYYTLSSITDSKTVVLTNLGYFGNAAAGGTVSTGAQVAAAGLRGPGASRVALDSYTLHCWRMDDASGTIVDTGSTVSSLSTLTGSFGYAEPGVVSDAIYLDGTTAGAKSANGVGNPTSTTQISLHGWVKLTAFTSYGRLMSKWYNTTETSPYDSIGIVFNASTGQMYAIWVSSGATKQTNVQNSAGRFILLLNFWYHLGFTFSQSAGTMTVKCYVNGVLAWTEAVTSGVIDWNGSNSGPWTVGLAGANTGITGWQNDWRVDDGIVRDAAYFNTLYKRGVGLAY